MSRPFRTLTIFSVATGIYVDYWMRMARSVESSLFLDVDVQLLVFTDDVPVVTRAARGLDRISVDAISVPPLKWPEATLKRYELLWDFQGSVHGEVVAHLDADMLALSSPPEDFDPASFSGGIGLVEHPGYYRRGLGPLLADIVAGGLNDVRHRSRLALARPQWETDRRSKAFVPRSLRKNYVCGGAWFGVRDAVVAMCGVLAARTTDDLARGVTARWHDESHLNWFAAYQATTTLPPSFCVVPGYGNLKGLPQYIAAVDKGSHRVRN